jgi:hypothetical protein
MSEIIDEKKIVETMHKTNIDASMNVTSVSHNLTATNRASPVRSLSIMKFRQQFPRRYSFYDRFRNRDYCLKKGLLPTFRKEDEIDDSDNDEQVNTLETGRRNPTTTPHKEMVYKQVNTYSPIAYTNMSDSKITTSLFKDVMVDRNATIAGFDVSSVMQRCVQPKENTSVTNSVKQQIDYNSEIEKLRKPVIISVPKTLNDIERVEKQLKSPVYIDNSTAQNEIVYKLAILKDDTKTVLHEKYKIKIIKHRGGGLTTLNNMMFIANQWSNKKAKCNLNVNITSVTIPKNVIKNPNYTSLILNAHLTVSNESDNVEDSIIEAVQTLLKTIDKLEQTRLSIDVAAKGIAKYSDVISAQSSVYSPIQENIEYASGYVFGETLLKTLNKLNIGVPNALNEYIKLYEERPTKTSGGEPIKVLNTPVCQIEKVYYTENNGIISDKCKLSTDNCLKETTTRSNKCSRENVDAANKKLMLLDPCSIFAYEDDVSDLHTYNASNCSDILRGGIAKNEMELYPIFSSELKTRTRNIPKEQIKVVFHVVLHIKTMQVLIIEHTKKDVEFEFLNDVVYLENLRELGFIKLCCFRFYDKGYPEEKKYLESIEYFKNKLHDHLEEFPQHTGEQLTQELNKIETLYTYTKNIEPSHYFTAREKYDLDTWFTFNVKINTTNTEPPPMLSLDKLCDKIIRSSFEHIYAHSLIKYKNDLYTDAHNNNNKIAPTYSKEFFSNITRYLTEKKIEIDVTTLHAIGISLHNDNDIIENPNK